MSDRKITEIIPDNMPDWFYKDMEEGQLFNRLIDRIESKWISVKDRLPTIPNGRSGMLCDLWVKFNLNGNESRLADGAYEYGIDGPEFNGNGQSIKNFTVTHWSIPEPPKDI